MAEATNRDWRLSSQAESTSGQWKQNYGLGGIQNLCQSARREDPSRDGRTLAGGDQCSDDLTGIAQNWFHSKKKTYGYRERDEAKRAVFVAQLSGLSPEQIVYLDESGMDSRDDYGYGWNELGERFHALKSGRRSGRVNMIAALCNQQLLAPFTIEGACNRTVFETWLEICLIPVLEPGQRVVMDNATFHKRGRIQQLIEEAGCQLLYLPPYSPDLNKIEHCWSWLKSRIRKQLEQFDSLRETMEHVLRLAS